jgi:putative membrane protein
MHALLLQATSTAGAHGEWESGAHPLLYAFDVWGPRLLALIVLALVVRALWLRQRYSVKRVLGEEAARAVHAALIEAEKHTLGEIVPVVVERSDRHPGAEWLSALVMLLVGTGLLAVHLPWHAPHWLLVCQIALAAVGYGLARALPDWKRWFVSEARATELAAEQAIQEFQALDLHATADGTGVLIFVSLLERRVIVLGDSAIHAKVGNERWVATKNAVLAGVQRGALDAGLIEGIRVCGAVLSEHFPWRAGDRNEVPDRMIVRVE